MSKCSHPLAKRKQLIFWNSAIYTVRLAHSLLYHHAPIRRQRPSCSHTSAVSSTIILQRFTMLQCLNNQIACVSTCRQPTCCKTACYYRCLLSTVEFADLSARVSKSSRRPQILVELTCSWFQEPSSGVWMLMFVASWLAALSFFLSIVSRNVIFLCSLIDSQQWLVFLRAFSFDFPTLLFCLPQPSSCSLSNSISPCSFFTSPAHRNSSDYFCLSHLPTWSLLFGSVCCLVFQWLSFLIGVSLHQLSSSACFSFLNPLNSHLPLFPPPLHPWHQTASVHQALSGFVRLDFCKIPALIFATGSIAVVLMRRHLKEKANYFLKWNITGQLTPPLHVEIHQSPVSRL